VASGTEALRQFPWHELVEFGTDAELVSRRQDLRYILGVSERKLLKVYVARFRRREEDNARLVVVTPRLEGAFDADKFWFLGVVALEAFKVCGLLAAIPGVPVLGGGIPVVSILGEVAVLEDLVFDHDTGHSVDQLRLVENLYRVDLTSAAIFPG